MTQQSSNLKVVERTAFSVVALATGGGNGSHPDIVALGKLLAAGEIPKLGDRLKAIVSRLREARQYADDGIAPPSIAEARDLTVSLIEAAGRLDAAVFMVQRAKDTFMGKEGP